MSRSTRLTLAAFAAAFGLVGCGGNSPPQNHKKPITKATLQAQCPSASGGHGVMGGCAPKAKLGLTAPHPVPPTAGLPVFPDRSNNDPCYCGAQIKAAGQVGLIVKANQGPGFIDSTAVGMVNSARSAGLAVGMYDFDQNYSIGEAQVFVNRLHAAGIYPNSRNTFPATFDVEYGFFSMSGLKAQIAYVQHQGYRVQIYTGGWYWTPHAGCSWVGLPVWLSGYPTAILPCGIPASFYLMHQYTSTPIDLSVFLPGSSAFRVFVNNKPVPPPTPKCLSLHKFPHTKQCYIIRYVFHKDTLDQKKLERLIAQHKCFKAGAPGYCRGWTYWLEKRTEQLTSLATKYR